MAGHPTRGRARIDVVVPFSNSNLEPDMAMLCPPGVSVHFARAGGYDLDAIPDEHQMRRYSDAPFEEVVGSLSGCRPDIVLYGGAPRPPWPGDRSSTRISAAASKRTPRYRR